MKSIYLFVAAMLVSCMAWAQTSFPVPATRSVSGTIEAVLADFPNNLHSISGELVVAEGGVEYYQSLVTLPGAEACTVARYRSVEDTTASWQSTLFRSEEFAPAAARYRELYAQLKGCHLRLVDGSLVFLKGEWEAPKEANDFTMSSLRLITGDARYKEVKIDLEMIYHFPEWVIHVNVVSKKKDSLEGYANGDGQ